ncbi:hypothetical protein RUM43_000647 [Polyplax serrata]|uniref:Uncharacterized protein n=1 Tax=Polyplax serrata TaxID=468196 RepID=A0AAN8XPC7_POLSC
MSGPLRVKEEKKRDKKHMRNQYMGEEGEAEEEVEDFRKKIRLLLKESSVRSNFSWCAPFDCNRWVDEEAHEHHLAWLGAHLQSRERCGAGASISKGRQTQIKSRLNREDLSRIGNVEIPHKPK